MKAKQMTIVDSSCHDTSVAKLTPDERNRYSAWMRRFQMLDSLNWLGIGLAVGSGFGFRYYSANAWRNCALLGFALFFVTRVWLRVLACPRCGATYSGGIIKVFDGLSFLNKCYGCDLRQRDIHELLR